ncbi:MAG TPA: hypothetical protein VLC55_07915 [Burkholderiales bacterium]|nr:hypothetical protein [Burkholderiales bacterium]
MNRIRLQHCIGIAAALLLAGCVTINIYFPAAAAEKAADLIIDEVWQVQKQEGKPDAPVKPKPEDAPSSPATPAK